MSYLQAISQAVIDGTQAVVDGWQNSLRGIGESMTGAGADRFVFERAGKVAWLELVDGDWLAEALVTEYPAEALRQGFMIKNPIDGTTDDQTLATLQALDAAGLDASIFMRALVRGRTIGGCAIVMAIRNHGEETTPINPAKPAEIAWLKLIDADEMIVQEIEKDPSSPIYNQPSIYKVTGGELAGNYYHASRVIWCEGLPRQNRKPIVIGASLQNWQSVLQPARETLSRYGVGWAGVFRLLGESSIVVMKLKGLVSAMASQDGALFERRARLMNLTRSLARATMVDAENEDISRLETSFAGISDILHEAERQIVGLSKIPATRLFGQSPGGLNATGESDIRLFYDRVATYQRESIGTKLVKLASTIAGSPRVVEFPSLWQESSETQAKTRLTRLQGDEVAIRMGVVNELDVLQSRNADGSLGIDVADETIEARVAALTTGESHGAAFELTPTDLGAIVTVEEARASIGLPPLSEAARNVMTLAELRALTEAQAGAEGKAAGAAENAAAPSSAGSNSGASRGLTE